ncbi:MAG: hypothetical protein NC388_09410 [Clostridium sp.]|nr:hypothetical protein [Clostridium sp.]
MAGAATLSSQQLIVTVEDASVINDLKRAIKMMRGVSKITVKKPKKTELELAREDARSGRVTRWNSVDEMFKEILGE